MKKSLKKSTPDSYNQSDISVEFLIKLTAKEFGLTEDEVRACAVSFVQQNKSDYPTMRKPFITV